MVLLDCIARSAGVPENQRVTGHRIENAMTLYCHGKLTRAQMLAFFNIPAAMEADFDAIKTKYDSFATTTAGRADKLEWLGDFTACVIGLQLGDLTKAQFNTILGLSLSV